MHMKNQFLSAHNEGTVNYSGHSSRFAGYIQFGEIFTDKHEKIGYTSDQVQKFIACITSPNYLYSRQKNGYISIYGKDETSPTGVSLIGGIPDEMEYLLKVFGKTGQLSPTEDMRTAH